MALPLLAVTLLVLNYGKAQNTDCLQPADSQGRSIPFRDINGSPHLPSDTQAIVTSYRFNCCGNITRWQTYVQPGGGGHENGIYSIRFQVWRPLNIISGCYSIVGENQYDNIQLVVRSGGLVNETVPSSNIITVQPGDVVGYYTESKNGGNEGIELDTSYSDETMWYHTSSDDDPLIFLNGDCPYPIGSQSVLKSSTNAGPILSVEIVTSECQSLSTLMMNIPLLSPLMMNTPLPSPLMMNTSLPSPLMMNTPLPSPLIMSTSSPIPSGTPSPANPTVSTLFIPSSNERMGVVITVVGVLTAILLLIVTTMVIISIFQLRKKKRKNVRVENTPGVFNSNPESKVSQPQVPQSQGDIEMTKNIVYGMVSDSQVSQPQVPQSQGDKEMTRNIVYSDSQVSQPQVPQSQGEIEMTMNIVYGMVSDSQNPLDIKK